MRKGFTLIELLIVIGILAMVIVAVILTLNPGEFLRQARDARRLAEMKALQAGVTAFHNASPETSLGASSTVYVSLPDADPGCASHALEALPFGWTYRCAPESTYRLLDGTGWIPLNVATFARYVSISALPIDPVNNDERYYAYVAGTDEWEFSAAIESNKLGANGNQNVVTRDGGDDPARYEVGKSLTLQP